MDTSRLEVADIFRDYGELYRQNWSVTPQQRAAMRAIELCRTSVLGGHLYRCDACEGDLWVYNSCGNRHCPKCQSLNKEQWIDARAQELLPVPYFHIVFTLPHDLHTLARANQRWAYNTLLRSAHETILTLAKDPEHLGARIAGTSVLHTWSSKVTFHPHAHCIVQGAGPSVEGDRWISADEEFFLHVNLFSSFFAKTFIRSFDRAYHQNQLELGGALEELQHPVCFQELVDRLLAKRWVVFAKEPFAGPKTVVKYLARYTHRVAISNERLLRMEDDQVLFRYKDYQRGGQWGVEKIHATEFIRRFLLHVLPFRFVRIRYFGLLGNRYRKQNLERCRAMLHVDPPEPPPEHESFSERCLRLTGTDPTLCPACGEGRLVLRAMIPRPRFADLVARPAQSTKSPWAAASRAPPS